jgi:hypothetical protein
MSNSNCIADQTNDTRVTDKGYVKVVSSGFVRWRLAQRKLVYPLCNEASWCFDRMTAAGGE